MSGRSWGAGLFRYYGLEWNGNLFLGRSQRDVGRRVQVVPQGSDLLSVPAVHTLHRRGPVVLPGFVERAVGSEAAQRPTETREAQRQEEEHHGEDEEEDDEQGDPDRIGLCSGSGRSAVHAASVTRVPAVRRSPAHVAVTVLITVTHPVTAAFSTTSVHAEHRRILTFLIQTRLSGPAGGSLGHGGRVGHVVVQVEESPSADQVAVVEADGEDLGDAAQQGALRAALTLDPAAENVLVFTGDVGAVAQLTTVSIFVSLLVDGGEAHRRGAAGVGSPQHLALGVHVGADSSVAVGGAVLAGLSVLQEDIGGAVGGGACAVLGQVALSERLAAHGARRAQLTVLAADTVGGALSSRNQLTGGGEIGRAHV